MFDLTINAWCAEAGLRDEDERAARALDNSRVRPVVVVA